MKRYFNNTQTASGNNDTMLMPQCTIALADRRNSQLDSIAICRNNNVIAISVYEKSKSRISRFHCKQPQIVTYTHKRVTVGEAFRVNFSKTGKNKPSCPVHYGILAITSNCQQ